MTISVSHSIIPENMKALCIVFHGYGADGMDLVRIGEYYSNYFPDMGFIFPNGIEACDVNPMGRQWFSLYDFNPSTIRGGLDKSGPIISQFIKQQSLKFKISIDDVVLMGFSQGCIVCLEMLYFFKKLKGIVGFSGAYYPNNTRNKVNETPVALSHGMIDSVVPYSSLIFAENLLKSQGFNIETHTSEYLAHGIDDSCLSFGKNFLRSKVFI